jgi:hypothetical protein
VAAGGTVLPMSRFTVRSDRTATAAAANPTDRAPRIGAMKSIGQASMLKMRRIQM